MQHKARIRVFATALTACRRAAVFTLLAIAVTPAVAQLRYRIADVGALPPYGSSTITLGINNAGQAAGYASGFLYHGAFLWTRGATDGVPGNPQLKDLGTLNPGDSDFNAQAFGLNSKDQVVGEVDYAWYAYKMRHAFYWQNGRMVNMGTLPGGLTSTARSINDNGRIVGWADTTGNPLDSRAHAFFYDIATKKMQDIGVDNSYAYSINNLDQVVGSYLRPDYSRHAFFWDNAKGFQDIHYLVSCGGVSTEAIDINDNEQIVGYCLNANRVAFAFSYNRRTSKFVKLNVPGSRAAAVNNKGVAVGFFKKHTVLDLDHAFVWSTNTQSMTDLNDVTISNTEWELFNAWDINDKGQIVGFGAHRTTWSESRGFVMTPDTTTPSLRSLTISPSRLVGGNSAVGTVTLTAPAPAGGARVTLFHYYWFVARIPKEVTVPAGATTYRFDIGTYVVSDTIPIEVTATYSGIKRAATFTLTRGW